MTFSEIYFGQWLKSDQPIFGFQNKKKEFQQKAVWNFKKQGKPFYFRREKKIKPCCRNFSVNFIGNCPRPSKIGIT